MRKTRIDESQRLFFTLLRDITAKKMNKNVPFPSAPPRVTSITTDGCLVEWSPVKPFTAAPADTILYRVQMSKNRETESKVVSVVPSFHRSFVQRQSVQET